MSNQIQIRDDRKKGYYWCANELIRRDAEALGKHGVFAYNVLASYAGNSDQTAWPSIVTMAKQAGVSQNFIRKGIRVLEVTGWLHIKPQYDPKTRKQTSHLYTLLSTPSLEQVLKGVQEMKIPPSKHAGGEGAQNEDKLSPFSEQSSKDSPPPAGAAAGLPPQDSEPQTEQPAWGDRVQCVLYDGAAESVGTIKSGPNQGESGKTFYDVDFDTSMIYSIDADILSLVTADCDNCDGSPGLSCHAHDRTCTYHPQHDASELVNDAPPADEPSEPAPKPERKRSAKQQANDALFDAVMELSLLTAPGSPGVKIHKGRCGRIIKAMKTAGYTEQQYRDAVTHFKDGFPAGTVSRGETSVVTMIADYVNANTAEPVKYIDGWTAESVEQAVKDATAPNTGNGGVHSDAADKFNEIMEGDQDVQ